MLHSRPSSTLAQYSLTAVVIFVAAAGGMYFGGLFQKSDTIDGSMMGAEMFVNLSLSVGHRFPSVALENRKYDTTFTVDLLNADGTVILFIDANCPPCHGLVKQWQEAINDGLIGSNQVIGISYGDAADFDGMRTQYDVRFRIYSDPSLTFYDAYGIDGFPLTVVVGKSGTVVLVDGKLRSTIAKDRLMELLSR